MAGTRREMPTGGPGPSSGGSQNKIGQQSPQHPFFFDFFSRKKTRWASGPNVQISEANVQISEIHFSNAFFRFFRLGGQGPEGPKKAISY